MKTYSNSFIPREDDLCHIREHIDTVQSLSSECLPKISELSNKLLQAFRKGNTLFFCGNGGSASQAQHLAAEFVGRYLYDRKALKSLALTSDSAVTTCISNDYGYDEVFSRQLEGLSSPGDVLVALSTSGKSPNVVNAIRTARQLELYTVLFTGDMLSVPCDSDMLISVKHPSTAIIQECHLLLGHILCANVESQLLKI